MKYTVPTGSTHHLFQQWNADYYSLHWWILTCNAKRHCTVQLGSTAASLPKTLWVAGLGTKGSEGGTEVQRGCAGSSHLAAQCFSHASKIALPDWPNQTAFLCGTNSNICLQSGCSFVILKLLNQNFNFPALIPMQIKGFYAQCSLHFLAAAWGKAMWKSCLELSWTTTIYFYLWWHAHLSHSFFQWGKKGLAAYSSSTKWKVGKAPACSSQCSL